ncbi:hypothetical protein BT63DRAFT_414207 [Microthyrium microscopicum]|uniref:CNH domain-containing protein n=1 Tax=Microthyrium microscopicum TaxID=703497 RepID=A0A6A6U7C9_9PEZI|nr:hypothetical protein BT63DRAFT_414207 [Microthyrium microscopicum]
MLTAFSARPLVELRQRDKSKIESLLAYGDRLLVGLNTGSLRIYRVNEPSSTPQSSLPETPDDGPPPSPTKKKPVDLMREEEKFSKKPIQQLAIIKEASILISLSDNYVSLHDLQSYSLQKRLEKTKGATLFAAASNIVKDGEEGIPSIVSRLAVAVKRKILLWSWQDMELTEEVAEITLVAAAKSLTWASGTKIVAGLDSGFVMVDIETMEITDIMKSSGVDEVVSKFGAVSSTGMSYMGMGSWVPKPMATKLYEDEILLAKDVHTLFIDSNSKPLDKRQVPWPTAPEGIGYSYPYLLALQPPAKGNLEVRNPDTLSLLQSIPLPNATLLHVPQPNISLAHAGKGFLVGSDRCIWRMTATGYDRQIEELTSKELYDEAISLISMLEDTLLLDKEDRLRVIKMMKAQKLFEQRKYRDSLELFADATAPPHKVISMYPKSIAGSISMVDGEDVSEEELENEAETETSPEGKKSVESTPQSTVKRTMFGRLRGEVQKAEADTASVKSAKMSEAGDSNKAGDDKPLEGKDLIKAVNELCAFLAQTRVKLQKIMTPDGKLKQPLPTNPPKDYRPEFHQLIGLSADEQEDVDWHEKLMEVATIVDTTLFRAYMLARPGLAGSLFRLANFCDPKVVRDKLYETGRYADLIDFLHGKRLHHEALEMLERFGKDVDNETISPALRGPQRTIAYLQQLPPEHIDLILEYAKWPVRQDADAGMEIFIADTENAETLPRERVLDFLQRINPLLATRYLEHIITELSDMTPDFHQRLIDLYLERLHTGRESKPEYGGFTNQEEKLDCKQKLERFLRSSEQYNRSRIFVKLSADDADLFESRAIVLSKMGQHKQALQICVFQIQDYAKAEEYCNQTYLTSQAQNLTSPAVPLTGPDKTNDDTPSIYHTLLSLYLTPPPPHTPKLEPALDLLSAHGARLPASQTLSLIPQDLKIATLESYFTGRIRTANTVLNSERIVAQLRAVRQAATQEAYMGERNKRVVVTEDRLCPVCMKRFGNSAVRVYPDGKVVHYGCFNRGTGAVAGWGKRHSAGWA